jgi:hypothetical protein
MKNKKEPRLGVALYRLVRTVFLLRSNRDAWKKRFWWYKRDLGIMEQRALQAERETEFWRELATTAQENYDRVKRTSRNMRELRRTRPNKTAQPRRDSATQNHE